MKRIAYFIVSLSIISPWSGSFSLAAKNFNLKVKLRHAGYEIQYDGNTFAYADSVRETTIHVNACTRKETDLLLRQIQKMWKRQNIEIKTPLAAIDVQMNEQKKRIPFDSPFGQLLNSVPKRMMVIDVQERKPCSLNKKY